ncbi:MAG: cytochrome B [Comamonadaceae bacterium]|nr:cytochrome B [Comamonadaceae bacterium]
MTSPSTDTTSPRTVIQPLWDAPVRLLHALMVLSLAGAWLTAESQGWRAVHISFGLTLAGAMILRLLWGFVGTPPARFASFVRGPAAVAAHLRGLLAGRAGPHAGHNPAGGWAVLALLATGLLAAGSGWLAWQGGEAWEDVHETLANALLLLAGVHVAAVLLMSRLAHDRLVPAMLTGRKAVPAGTPPTRSMHRLLAAALLVATLGFWAWSLGPTAPWHGAAQAQADGDRHHGDRHHDDD